MIIFIKLRIRNKICMLDLFAVVCCYIHDTMNHDNGFIVGITIGGKVMELTWKF